MPRSPRPHWRYGHVHRQATRSCSPASTTTTHAYRERSRAEGPVAFVRSRRDDVTEDLDAGQRGWWLSGDRARRPLVEHQEDGLDPSMWRKAGKFLRATM